ncbi:MAG TPA: DUF3006 domain-containing protein [Candidatus Fermentibacter daniensis]|nr:DUF3006 domain-containing protein [Candidatus Fermentibacter daniensis]HOR07586.1 DUF3006 domain-containing protein [Candidatus Fermentibacter daniensis]HPK51508.1 DUF3006 domain-containing protein [Candidatus Fermentibacter daniensis]HQH92246.1 DUF3006 domain-containing protein [Candidatus Fermentibacter daniensis]
MTVTLDRTENGVAVLLLDDGQRLLVPARIIPQGCPDGTVLRMTFERDDQETEARMARVRALRERLVERSGD